MRNSKSIVSAVVAVSAIIGVDAVSAADMAVKAGPVVVNSSYNWTGFYAGLNVGFGWRDDPGYTTNLTNCVVGGACGAGGLVFGNPLNQALGSALGTGSTSSGAGFAGGVQAGYNWQSSGFLIGLEADVDYFQRGTSLAKTGIVTTGDILTVTNQSNSNWIATIRPRVGLVWDRLLVYATGGAAFTRLEYRESMVTTLGASSGAFSVSQTKTGWTVGAGAEYALADRWSVRAEYLYAQFNGLAGTGGLVSTVPAGFSNVFTGRTGTFNDNILRVGLNYRFGGPIVAAY